MRFCKVLDSDADQNSKKNFDPAGTEKVGFASSPIVGSLKQENSSEVDNSKNVLCHLKDEYNMHEL